MSQSLLPNSVISHYRILSKIGAGGMGEVYLAQDTKLDRKVALKILPADLADDETRMSRFVREAKSASALNHPNILTIHEIGEDSSQHYIATEFIDGKTLRELMRSGPLPIAESLEIVCQIGAALNAAHQAGIIHRDIKPENVMVRGDGLVKVLDFGLAKLTGGSADPESETRIQSETQPGIIMGTVAYMSPQQARGKAVDARTDVWSLGVVIYELLSGRQPFRGETMTDTLANILHQEPEPLSIDPPDLGPIINKMLSKTLETRYASVNDVVVELKYLQRRIEFESELDRKSPLNKRTEEKTVMIPSTTSPEPFSRPAIDSASARADEGFWVAVLPFKVRDADPEVTVLADGLSEEIGTGLSRFRYLSVVTNNSAGRLKDETKDELSVAAKLGTRYVLAGSIRKGGSAIRVSAQLVDTETGAQLWSETYNRDLQTSTIFAVQDDVAGRIVATVADSYGVLVHSMRAAMLKKDDADLKPVEWQFQYFAYREQITPLSHAALKSRLQRVAERNVEQSDVWACLAQIYVDEYAFGFEGDATSLDRALAAGRRAVELDRANQFALVALAQVHFFRRDLAAFGPAAERGMALNPLNTDALGILGLQIVHTGEFERGTAIVRRAMELNPNHAGWMHFAPLWNHFHKGEYEQALECANRVDVPGLFWPYLVMASACGHLGRRAEATAAVRDLLALDPEFGAHARSNVGTWHFASGLIGPLLAGLRKAGLEISDDEPASTASTPSLASSETRADEGFWVAVLPFKYSSTGAELKSLAEGLSEDIVMGLSRFSYLRVIARGSTLRYANQTIDLRTVGKELGARYVMEGSLRQAGSKLRLAVQLVDATTGAHLWAENYEREFSSENIFELQDDLVPRVVSTVADWYGALPHSMSETVRLKPPDQLSPYEALLRSFGYFENIAAEEHAFVRSSLERAVAQEPGNADGWAMLSMIFGEEHRFGFNVRPDSLGRSLEAARKAVEIAHANHFAWLALAQALFFRKEFDPFRDAAERAIALNPMDGSTVEYLGHLIAFSGNWERGCELAERARQLNPNHPSWYWSVPFLDAYRKGDYLGARPFLLKGNPQKNWLMQALLAAVHGQLGEMEGAASALREVLTMMPDFPSIARSEFSKWYLPDLVDQLMDGLRKAGLETIAQLPLTKSSPSLASSEMPADEGFWVAVLPFKFTGSNTAVATLAEGLSEEIITGLSRFSYLRVISRSSALRYANETDDVRAVGKTLGARYVMEGSLRTAGSSLRISVQLIDASTGAHLWAETYDRQFRAEEVFALQDDLVPRIVSTVADVNGVLPRSMSEAVCNRNPVELTPYEAVLRSFRYFDRVTAEELTAARSCLEIAVEKAPSNADAWAMLALLFHQDYGQGFNLHPDALNLGTMAAQRAVESGPSNHLAYFSLAQARFFQKDFQSFRNAAERAVALNPMDGNSVAFMGELLTYLGDWERGLALASRAKQINPNHPGWFWYADYFYAYRQGDYSGALSFALKANLPGHWGMQVAIAAAAGQLGDREAAGKAVSELLKLRPDFTTTIHNELRKWFDAEYRERLIEGLRKAGLEIPEEGATAFSRPASFTRPAIVVLPFVNRSPDADNEYFSDGLTEELISDLSQVRSLRVISRNSAMRLKGTTKDLKTIAAELNVRYVLDGSVRKAGQSVRISVQLIEAASDENLWAEKYDGTLADIFEMQESVSRSIVEALKITLSADEERQLTDRPIADAQAYDLYLQARSQFLQGVPSALDRSIELLKQGLEIIGENELLYAALGYSYYVYFRWISKLDENRIRLASECMQKAFALNPASSHGFVLKGLLSYSEGNMSEAIRSLKKALELQPNNTEALFWVAVNSSHVGDNEAAMRYADKLLLLDPLLPINTVIKGVVYIYKGESSQALPWVERGLALDPSSPLLIWTAAIVDAWVGRTNEAIAHVDKLAEIAPDWVYTQHGLFLKHALRGEKELALQYDSAELTKEAEHDCHFALHLAHCFALVHEHDKALGFLELAVRTGMVNYPFLNKFDPLLENLRHEERFKSLMLEAKELSENIHAR